MIDDVDGYFGHARLHDLLDAVLRRHSRPCLFRLPVHLVNRQDCQHANGAQS